MKIQWPTKTELTTWWNLFYTAHHFPSSCFTFIYLLQKFKIVWNKARKINEAELYLQKIFLFFFRETDLSISCQEDNKPNNNNISIWNFSPASKRVKKSQNLSFVKKAFITFVDSTEILFFLLFQYFLIFLFLWFFFLRSV